jgi:hypothetical protein
VALEPSSRDAVMRPDTVLSPTLHRHAGVCRPLSAVATRRLLDGEWVGHWSARYLAEEMEDGLETVLFTEVGREVRARGHFLKSEMVAIGRWRSNRATGHLKSGTDWLIESVSALALDENTPWRLRDRVLCVLDGVAEAMASALLTVWDPQHYTLLDRRSVESIESLLGYGALEEPRDFCFPTRDKDHLPSFVPYLEFFGSMADRVGVDFRSLDRALWKWHKDGMPVP